MNVSPLPLASVVVTCGLLGWWEPSQALGQPSPSQAAADSHEWFERRVRPVLAEHCWQCHGAKKQEGGLRLDSREALLRGGDGGPVVELSDVSSSRLLKAVRRDDTDLEMPPPPAPRLTDQAIDDLARWLAAGAAWPAGDAQPQGTTPDPAQHWAFQAPRMPEIPNTSDESWPTSAIDRFVLARLEAAEMTPAPPADRRTLLRRATIDLVGLPPSDAEIEAFLADSGPDAFARVVDRLLDSPHYGERWARHWLDVARYADTKGYVRLAEERRFHHAYSYRDWVIRALNEDLPYNLFIERQLAADLVADSSDPSALAALGFLALGRQFTGNRYDILDDRIDVVGRGLLGLTVACARCHDHKYDPISTADYYALYGIFATSEEPIIPPTVGPPPGHAESEAFHAEFERRRHALEEYEVPQYAALVNEFRRRSGDYLLEALAGFVPLQQPLPKNKDEIRQVVVNRWVDYLGRVGRDDPVFGPWHALADVKEADFAAKAQTLVADWRANSQGETSYNVRVIARLGQQPPQTMADVARAYGELLADVHRRWQELSTATVAAASGQLERLADPADEQLRRVLYSADSPVAVSRQEALAEYLYDAPINNEIYKLRNALNEHLANTAKGPPRAHTLVETGVDVDARILIRGNPARAGKRVPRQFLAVLSRNASTKPRPAKPFAAATARLELAQAITDRDNPLTARVLVNRVWAHHFGAGLVRTPSNFGLRGQAPTHPALLDYLAVRFMEEGWSIKKLHRWIMLSSTYRQSSHGSADFSSRDPENRLLWRMNRRRIDFETLRDALLVAAGELDQKPLGPSVPLDDAANRRRTVYALIDRQALPGVLPTFDFASPDTHTAERYTTTVPQQALFLLNGPLAVSVAKSFATRHDVARIAEPAARAARMIEIAWGRPATELEIRAAVDFVQYDQQAERAAGTLAAWESLAQALLLSNEFVYVD